MLSNWGCFHFCPHVLEKTVVCRPREEITFGGIDSEECASIKTAQ